MPGLLRVGVQGGGRLGGEVGGGGGGGREGEEEVLRLQVPMDDVAAMAGMKGTGDLPGAGLAKDKSWRGYEEASMRKKT